jgi:hypothetical protein
MLASGHTQITTCSSTLLHQNSCRQTITHRRLATEAVCARAAGTRRGLLAGVGCEASTTGVGRALQSQWEVGWQDVSTRLSMHGMQHAKHTSILASHHQHVQAAGCLRTCGWQQKLSVHVPLGHAVDCLLVSAVRPAPQV